MIKSGEIEDIRWSSGTWLIFDIGFSNKSRSCGLLLHDGKPKCYRFGEAVREVIRIIGNYETINLVIEAPLSVAFDINGNPKGRSVEKRGSSTRYWYFGPGCTVLMATTYFFMELMKSNPNVNIKLFEGFVSYKNRKNPSNHLEDVMLLRKTIMSSNPIQYCTRPVDLRIDTHDKLESAFDVAGKDFGIPPIIHGAKGG